MVEVHSFFSDDVEITLGEDGICLSKLMVNPQNVVCLAQDEEEELIILSMSNGAPIYISGFEGDEFDGLRQALA